MKLFEKSRVVTGMSVFAIGVFFSLYLAVKDWEATKERNALKHKQDMAIEVATAEAAAKEKASALAEAKKRKTQQEAAQSAAAIRAAAPPLTRESFAGAWSGTWKSTSPPNWDFHIDVSIDKDLHAVVTEYLLSGAQDKAFYRGCYAAQVEYDLNNRGFRVNPNEWIWVYAGRLSTLPTLSGEIDYPQMGIAGSMVVGGMNLGKFTLTRSNIQLKPNGCSLNKGE